MASDGGHQLGGLGFTLARRMRVDDAMVSVVVEEPESDFVEGGLALMFVTMVIAALIVNGAFRLADAIPNGPRPTHADIFGSIRIDYKLFLNLLGAAIFAWLFWLSARRGATDPVCVMRVDRAAAHRHSS